MLEPTIGSIPNPALRIHKPNLKFETNLKEDVFLPGLEKNAIITTDSQGFRTTKKISYYKKPKNTKRIFFVGGSTIEQLYISDEKTTPALLEKQLDNFYKEKGMEFEVINTGKSGAKSNNNYFVIKEIKKFKPDYVVLLVGANDMLRFVRTLGDNDDNGMYVKNMTKLMHPDGYHLSKDGLKYYLSHSRIIRRVWYLLEIAKGMKNNEVIELDGSQYKEEREKQFNTPIVKMPENLKTPAKYYSENLQEIIKLTKENNIKLLLLTQPVIYKDGLSTRLDKLLMCILCGKMRFSPGEMEQAMEAFNNALKEEAERGGADLIDLAKMLPKTTKVFYDDMHYNNNGALKIADILFEYFKNKL